HQARDFSADNFFSKHYLSTYYSYQMVYGTQDLQELVVRAIFTSERYTPSKNIMCYPTTTQNYHLSIIWCAMRV
ncbi:hypothetical protein S83_047309, partial [Arachis hypogaea]